MRLNTRSKITSSALKTLTGAVASAVLATSAYAAGLGLRARGYDKLAAGLFVLGGGLVLVGIALIGQIYNLSGRQSDAVLLSGGS